MGSSSPVIFSRSTFADVRLVSLLLWMLWGSDIRAAEVVFLNGDRLTGKIQNVTDGELILETDGAGEVTINLKKVKTFSTDEPVRIRVGDSEPFSSKIVAASPGTIETERAPASRQSLAINDITSINEQIPSWHGGVSLSGMLTRGNTERIEGGIRLELEKDWENDHLRFGAEYFYGRERDDDSSDKSTTDDYGEAFAKYERDLHDKLYVEGEFKVQHDSLAELEYRLTPNVGVGYRWFEDPHFTFYTELGIAYTYERYDTFGSRDYFGPMLEYGLEWRPIDRFEIFHSMEFYPSFSDPTGNFLINAAAGIHATLWKGLFVELRVEYHHDSEPAASAREGDFRVIFGPGWEF